MDYGVYFGDKSVGKAQVTEQGLYYHVVCRCSLSGEVMYRLEVSCGEKRENLALICRIRADFLASVGWKCIGKSRILEPSD